MNEFELIHRFFRNTPATENVVCGVGDDAAILRLPQNTQLVVSVDTLVADVHFPALAQADLIAERALRVSLSDLAAMGAEPLWFTLALTLPEANASWLENFSAGLFRAAKHYGCHLVGGDTTKGPLTISVQVMGAVAAGGALLRSGASDGDSIYVTGCLGDGAAALSVIKNELSVNESASHYLLNRFYRPEARFTEAKKIAGLASSAIDISDGLVNDLAHICEASGVGAEIDVEKLPISSPVRASAGLPQQEAWALAGGDDYELCFSVPENNVAEIERLIEVGELAATAIGKIVKGDSVACHRNGQTMIPAMRGYQHFG